MTTRAHQVSQVPPQILNKLQNSDYRGVSKVLNITRDSQQNPTTLNAETIYATPGPSAFIRKQKTKMSVLELEEWNYQQQISYRELVASIQEDREELDQMNQQIEQIAQSAKQSRAQAKNLIANTKRLWELFLQNKGMR